MLQRGHSGDGCVLASTLCKYDLRKGDLFVLSWARVRRVRRGSSVRNVWFRNIILLLGKNVIHRHKQLCHERESFDRYFSIERGVITAGGPFVIIFVFISYINVGTCSERRFVKGFTFWEQEVKQVLYADKFNTFC